MDVLQKSTCFLAIFLCLLVEIRGYNLDTRIPVIKQGDMGSYFGFSVTGHTFTERKSKAADGYKNSILLIGAPKFNTPEQGFEKPAGAIFKCPFSSETNDCERLFNDLEGNEADEDKSDQWLGVRVDSQGPGGIVGACAHRYRTKSDAAISGYGKCWKMDSNLELDLLDGIYEPCKGLHETISKQFYSLCQAGTGLHIIPQSKTSDDWWLVGAPGAGDWRGGVFGTTTLNIKTGDFYNVRTPLVSIIDGDDKTVEENKEKLGVQLNSYLGFSVTAGKFSDDGVQIVAGAPRVENTGAVVIFKPLTGLAEVNKQHVMDGTTMTESYGYSVCVADLNGDGYDDLIVGAPLYYDRYTNAGGRVYIYLNQNKTADFSQEVPIILEGKLDSMFGISVINVGDLDLDGKQDIAIGAPYENNGEGVVYIYHGSEDGISQPPTQVIRPSDLPLDLPVDRPFNYTFGYSLAGRIDLDGNDYPELVVGSFETDTVVTLRGRPIITIIASVNSSLPTLDPDLFNCEFDDKPAMCFNVSVVMRQRTNAESFEGVAVDVLFSIVAEAERREELRKPSRVIFNNTKTYEITDQKMTLAPMWDETDTISEQYEVIIQKGFTDVFRPIPFTLSYRLDEKIPEMPQPGQELPNMEEYPILEGITDPDGTIKKETPSLTIDFAKECAKDDGVCITDLSMDVSINIDGDPPLLLVGKQNEVEVVIKLENKNEAAYEPKVEIVFPEALQFRQFGEMANTKCDDTEIGLITCNLGSPSIYPTTTKPDIFVFKFDTSFIPATMDNFTISINATSANEDSNPDDNSELITVQVMGVTDMQLFGERVDQFKYSGEVFGESYFDYEDDIGMLVKHVWKVTNDGPAFVNSSKLTIYFPFESSTGKWLLYMTDPPEMDKGSCVVPPGLVNPAGFKKRGSEEESDYNDNIELATEVPTLEPIVETSGKTTDKETGESDRNSRRRRDTSDQVLLRKKRQSGQKTSSKNAKILDCMSDAADAPQCFQIICTIDALDDDESATVTLRSRVWNSTYIEDYIGWHEVELVSYGLVEITNIPHLTQTDTANDQQALRTKIIKDLQLVSVAPIKWWIILLAVLGGLLLLLILILILLKCGFFKRKNRAYKYANVQQVTAAQGKTDKRIYYDDSYMYSPQNDL